MIRKLKQHVMRRSRLSKLEHFYSLSESSDSVLDVGVSNNEHNDQVNLFLNTFRYSDGQYTGLGVLPLDNIAEKNPGKRFVVYPGGVFPFGDKEFDWVFSNAVIEHVGDEQAQLQFINEMVRVSRNVFFTTPNKYFPIESHTNTIVRHWFDKSFYRWCKKNKPFWSEKNLILLDYGNLKKLLRKSDAQAYIIQKNRTLGWPMTFTVVCTSAG